MSTSSRRRARHGRERGAAAVVAALLFTAALLTPQTARAQGPAGASAQGQGLSLDDDTLLELALENSERIELAELSREQSALDVELARALRRPQISASLDVSYLTNPLDPIVIRTGEFGTYDIGGVATQVPPDDVRVFEGMEATLFRLFGVVEQPVFTWGKLNLGLELAQESLALQTTRLSQTELEVALELRTAAAAARHLHGMAIRAGDQAALAAELERLVRIALDSGVVVQTDVLEARVRQQQAQLAVVEIRNALETRMVTLRRLTGRDELRPEDLGQPRFGRPAGGPDDGLPSGTPRVSIRPVEELITRAVAINPGLATLEQAGVVASRGRELAAAEARRRPDIGMRLEFAFTGPRIPPEPDWYGQDEGNLTISVGLQSSLYDGGTGRAEAGLTRIDEASLAVELADAIEALAGRIREAILATELAIARAAYLQSNAELLNAKRAVSEREFEAGVGSRDGVVRAKMEVIANELELSGELLTLELSVITLETLCGDEVLQ